MCIACIEGRTGCTGGGSRDPCAEGLCGRSGIGNVPDGCPSFAALFNGFASVHRHVMIRMMDEQNGRSIYIGSEYWKGLEKRMYKIEY